MRICHVITRLIIGGAQENTVLTCRGLTERGHEVTLISGPETGPEGSLWDKAEVAGCALVRVNSLRRAVRPISDWRAARELRRLFLQLQPDVVHTHSSKAGILGRWAAAMAGVPVVVHTIHGMSFNRTQGRLTQLVYRGLERSAARYTTSFVAVADAMVNQAVAAGIAPRQQFVTIRSGVETERFTPDANARRHCRKEWGVRDDNVVVGTIARLFPNKGHAEILLALASAIVRQPKLRFVWIGDGTLRHQFEKWLKDGELGEFVRMVGLVPTEKVPYCINGFDVMLHASRWEGLPRAVVQGLLSEVPAVSFDNDGAPEVVRTGETGILVPLGDINGLSDALVRLAGDAELRRDMGRRGRELCRKEFDWHNMVEQLEQLYGRLLASKPSAGSSGG